MKSDRELLALAARAAGHTLGPDWDCLPEGIFINGDDRFSGTEWNPLTDDGDALRLAVKLGIFVGRGAARLEGLQHLGSEWITEGWLDDPMPATRRAIVIAAAAIGESMQ